jgi:hypothetical protein
MATETVKLNLWTTAELSKNVRREAKRLGLTQTQFIRVAIQEKLKRAEREAFVAALAKDKERYGE